MFTCVPEVLPTPPTPTPTHPPPPRPLTSHPSFTPHTPTLLPPSPPHPHTHPYTLQAIHRQRTTHTATRTCGCVGSGASTSGPTHLPHRSVATTSRMGLVTTTATRHLCNDVIISWDNINCTTPTPPPLIPSPPLTHPPSPHTLTIPHPHITVACKAQ